MPPHVWHWKGYLNHSRGGAKMQPCAKMAPPWAIARGWAVGLHNFVPAGRPPASRFQDAGNNFAPTNFSENCSSGRRLKQFCSFPNRSVSRCPARAAAYEAEDGRRQGRRARPCAKPGARGRGRMGRRGTPGLHAAAPVSRAHGWPMGPRNKILQKTGTNLCKPTEAEGRVAP